MPLEIRTKRREGILWILGPKSGEVTLKEISVKYDGDNRGGGYFVKQDGSRLAQGAFPTSGSSTTINYKVEIPPIDKGQRATPVKRSIFLRRT